MYAPAIYQVEKGGRDGSGADPEGRSQLFDQVMHIAPTSAVWAPFHLYLSLPEKFL